MGRDADKELMRDVQLVRFARLFAPSDCERLARLIGDKLVAWRWNEGIPIYDLTDAGRALLASDARKGE